MQNFKPKQNQASNNKKRPSERSAFSRAGQMGLVALKTFVILGSVEILNLFTTGCTQQTTLITSYVHDTITVVKDASKKEYQALLTLKRDGVATDTLTASKNPLTLSIGGLPYNLSVIGGGVDTRTNQRAVLLSLQSADLTTDSTLASIEQWLVLNTANKNALQMSLNGETVELVLNDASFGMSSSQSQNVFLRILYNGKPLSLVSLEEGGHRVITTYEDSDQTDITVSDSVAVQSVMTGQSGSHARLNGRNLSDQDSIKLGSGLTMVYLGNGIEDPVNPAIGSLVIAYDTTTVSFSIPATAMDTSVVLQGNLWQVHSDGIKVLYLSGEQIGAASDQVTLSDSRGNSASKGVGFYKSSPGSTAEYVLHYGGVSVQLGDAVSSAFGKARPANPVSAGTPPQ